MPRGYIWPLVARKRQKKGFSGPQNKVLRIFWPPEAKNDSLSVNTKNNNFEYDLLVCYAKRSFSASWRPKNVENLIPWTGKLFILPLWPPHIAQMEGFGW